jgi:hypothetical protein
MGFPKIVWKSSLRKKQQQQQQQERSIEQNVKLKEKGSTGLFGMGGGSKSKQKGPSKAVTKSGKEKKKEKKGLFGAVMGKNDVQKKRDALIEAEEIEHLKMHHFLRLTLYLQAKVKEEARRVALIRDEEDAHKRMHFTLRMGIYIQALANEGASVRERFMEAQQALQRGLQFRGPLSETEAAGSDPSRNRKKKRVDPDQHEIRIGVVPPSLKALILAAAMELRPVPEEHKKEYKPIMSEAAEIGRNIRLPEKHLVAYGTPKPDPKDLHKSIVWSPRQRVELPKITNKRSKAQQVVVEAAALGRIRRLRPKVTYNYVPSAQEMGGEDDEDVDVDDILDEHGAKDIRTRHLTNQHVNHLRHEKKRDYWDPDEQVHYNRLEDVKLPTQDLPLYKPKNAKKLSHKEYMEGISRGVAEYAWDRRYRLDRPNKELRIKQNCTCRYCQTSNPYQTNAYRKKWLVKQGLWTAPPPPPPRAPPPPVNVGNAQSQQVSTSDSPHRKVDVKASASKLSAPKQTVTESANVATPHSQATKALGANSAAPKVVPKAHAAQDPRRAHSDNPIVFPPSTVETGGDAVSESPSTPETESSHSASASDPETKQKKGFFRRLSNRIQKT